MTLVILGEYKLPWEEPIILLVLTLRFVTLQGKPNQSNHFKFCDLFLYSRHLYFQLTSEKKKKCKMLFNVWVACKSRYLPAFVYWACEAKCWVGHLLSQAEGQNTLGEKSQQHVVATSQWQIALCVLENFVKIFCLCNRILSLQQVTKNRSDWICATCYGNKIP